MSEGLDPTVARVCPECGGERSAELICPECDGKVSDDAGD